MLDHIRSLRVKVDTFCPWQFPIWLLVFGLVFSMNSADEECSWTGRDLPGKGPHFRQILNFYYQVVMTFDLEVKECVHLLLLFFLLLLYIFSASVLWRSLISSNKSNLNCHSLCLVFSSPHYFHLKVFQGFTSIPRNHPLTTAHCGWAFRAAAWCALLHLRACPSLPVPVSVSLQLFHTCLPVRVCKNQNRCTFTKFPPFLGVL